MPSKDLIMTAIALVAISSAFILAPVQGLDAAEAYDKDYGTFYSYTLQFVFDGSDAESIEWDFGDGSPVSTEWNPSHTYTDKGEYIVTQTTRNSYEGGSTTVEHYRVNIAGFPVITFDSNGGSSVPSIQQTAYKVTATEPQRPTRSGYDFAGWFTDPELTAPMDWSSEIRSSMTLYAKWTEDSGTVDPEDPVMVRLTFDVSGGSVAIDDETIESGTAFIVPDYIGSKDGFRFKGWDVNGDLLTSGERITVVNDTLFTAVWEKVDTPVDPEEPDEPGKEIGDIPWHVVVILIIAILFVVGLCIHHYNHHRGGF